MLKSLTPTDIEQIKHDMNRRRAEALSRHAAEIMSLDSDQSEVEAFERSLDAFMKKFIPQEEPSSAPDHVVANSATTADDAATVTTLPADNFEHRSAGVEDRQYQSSNFKLARRLVS